MQGGGEGGKNEWRAAGHGMQATCPSWNAALKSLTCGGIWHLPPPALHTFATSRRILTAHDAFMPNLTRLCSCRSSSLTTHSGGRWELGTANGLPACCK